MTWKSGYSHLVTMIETPCPSPPSTCSSRRRSAIGAAMVGSRPRPTGDGMGIAGDNDHFQQSRQKFPRASPFARPAKTKDSHLKVWWDSRWKFCLWYLKFQISNARVSLRCSIYFLYHWRISLDSYSPMCLLHLHMLCRLFRKEMGTILDWTIESFFCPRHCLLL